MPGDVSLLLVSHDGARWLPAVLDGIAAQEAPVQRCVAVDTGSRDESPALLAAAFGPDHVVGLASTAGFPAAVRAGMEHLDALGPTTEWVWLLHDDASPHPEALLALLAGVADHPDADVLGPLLREWPSLKRLLECGVTISGTGRRETGLERGEYDQGQYADVRPVLAVNTAGMLVRRRVLDDLGGFAEELPLFGNDIDFGWRAAAAGHRTLVIPQAIVFHAEAAHQGLRRTALTGRHTHYQERRAALFTLLANSPSRAWGWQAVRLALGTLVRMMGFAAVRAPGAALDDLAALVSVLGRPGELRRARQERRAAAVVPAEEVRALLPPRWVPYRNGLDAVGDAVAALFQQAGDVAERRRAAAAERDPASFAARRAELERADEELAADTGLAARFLTNPVAVVLTLVVLAALVGARAAIGPVSGGGLSPAPVSVADWWSLHLESWHRLGTGTAVPAPAYVVLLALLGTALAGHAAAAVSLLLVAAVPAGLWGAWRFLRVAGRFVSPAGAPRWLILWGATSYALVAVVAGAWGGGRLGPVVTTAALPWLAHASLGFADPDADRRQRAGWRAGLLLTVVTAFAPVVWMYAAVLAVVVVVLALRWVPSGARGPSTWGPPMVALLVAPVLLAPWWVPALQHGAAAGLVLDAGRWPEPSAGGLGLVLGRLGDGLGVSGRLGAPWWLGAVVPVLAVLALIPRRTRVPVLVAWLAAVVALAVAALLSLMTLHLAAASLPASLAALLVVVQGALITAVVLGALGPVESLRSGRRPAVMALGGVLAVAATVVPVGGLTWFVAGPDEALGADQRDDVPAYMVQAAAADPAHGVLVVRGSVARGLSYTVRRGDGVTVGEDEVGALTGEDRGFTALVRTLGVRPTAATADALGADGIAYVVLPAPADADVAAGLDATSGLVAASAGDRETRAWQVDRPLTTAAIDGHRSWLRVALLVVQALGVLVVAVLCAPSVRRRRP